MNQNQAEQAGASAAWAVISITRPIDAEPRLAGGWFDVLRLKFDDVDGAHEGSREFSKEQAEQVVSYVRRVAPSVDCILVHCHAGLSRSAAVAKFIAESQGLAFPEHYAVYNRFVYRSLNKVLWAEAYGDDVLY